MRTSLILKVVFAALAAWAGATSAYSQDGHGNEAVIWVALAGRTQLKKVVPGAIFEGKLARSLYWRDTEIFPQGSTATMVVEKVEKRKKSYAVDDRPFVIHLFAPRHELAVEFRSVTVMTPGGVRVPLRSTFVALSQRAEFSAEPTRHVAGAGNRPRSKGGVQSNAPRRKDVSAWVVTLRAEPEGTSFAALAAAMRGRKASGPASCVEPCTIADGTRMHLVLLQGLSAAKDRQGESFRAMLLDPVVAGSAIAVPEGSIVQGVLAQRVPPRRLYRPGSLHLSFNRLALPNGGATAIAASPVAAEVDRGTHMTMDAEGRIHAQKPGKARFLLDFGVTGGISKISDDTTQLIIELISSTATDASTAGVAKIAATLATAIYMLTRHGRDVILPPFTEMDVSLSRATVIGVAAPAAAPNR